MERARSLVAMPLGSASVWRGSSGPVLSTLRSLNTRLYTSQRLCSGNYHLPPLPTREDVSTAPSNAKLFSAATLASRAGFVSHHSHRFREQASIYLLAISRGLQA